MVGTVVCGTGHRHLDVAKALGLEVTWYTAVVGGPEFGESSTGNGSIDIVRLADGSAVPYANYTTVPDSSLSAKSLVAKQPHNSIVCAGRPSMMMFGMDEAVAKGAAVYRLEVATKPLSVKKSETEVTRYEEGEIVRIVEVAATGEIEINAV